MSPYPQAGLFSVTGLYMDLAIASQTIKPHL